MKQLKILSKYIAFNFIILIYFEVLTFAFLNKSLEGFGVFNILFLVPISIVISGLVAWNKKTRNIESIITTLLLTVFYISQLIYFSTFGSLYSISMIGVGNQAITNFYWSIVTTIKENIIAVILYCLPLLIVIFDCIKTKILIDEYKLWIHPLMVLIGVICWLLAVSSLPLSGTKDYTPYGAYHSKYIDTDTASKKLGVITNSIVEFKYLLVGDSRQELIVQETQEIEEPIQEVIIYNINDKYDFSVISQNTNDNSVKNICDYLNSVKPSKQNEYTGMFKGYNLIYICAESFSRLAIDPVVTPTLYKLSNNGFVLNNYYNGFKNVTTNGEYAMLTGLWPNIARENTNMGALTGTMGQSMNKDMSLAIGNKFNTLGLQSHGYHNYYGSYYGRNKTLPNMGFECKFLDEGMSFTTKWPASDLEMMQQSIPDYINDSQFMAYYMTFSGHGNYTKDNLMCAKNYDEVMQLLGEDSGYNENAICYLLCNKELDKALEYLLDELQKANKLDNTVIVLTGDHYPYYLTDEGYACLNGKPLENEYEKYKSTCIIYNSKMDKTIINEPCCNVDILPTVLNLFGIDYDSRLYAGYDILSDSKHVAMLYNKSFITNECYYDSTNGNTIWFKQIDNSNLEEYVEKTYAYVKNKYAYSLAIEDTDFFKYLENAN